jgi:hypothetical protein
MPHTVIFCINHQAWALHKKKMFKIVEYYSVQVTATLAYNHILRNMC